MTVELGLVYRDPVSGFEGAATARTEFLCEVCRVQLTAHTGKAGDEKERWFYEGQLELVASPPGAGFQRGG